MIHGVYFEEDDEGWVFARCTCEKWEAGPFPGAEDAADAYGDHRAVAAVTDAAQATT